jgi:hypothetical protein
MHLHPVHSRASPGRQSQSRASMARVHSAPGPRVPDAPQTAVLSVGMERVAMAAKAANVITIERTTTLLHRASRPNEHDVARYKSGRRALCTATMLRSGVAFLKLRMSQFLSDTSVSTACFVIRRRRKTRAGSQGRRHAAQQPRGSISRAGGRGYKLCRDSILSRHFSVLIMLFILMRHPGSGRLCRVLERHVTTRRA